MQSSGSASDKQRELPLVLPGDEPDAGDRSEPESVHLTSLMARVLSRDNLSRALKQVRRNKGAPGIDGMTVDALPGYLREPWPEIRQRLVAGTYRPQPIRRVMISKPQNGERPLGIPTARDRFIQQAIAQVIQGEWEEAFHPHSYGFHPGRSAHQAVRHAWSVIRSGKDWVLDLDLEAFFDRVNHDRLMRRLQSRVTDKPLLRLINRYLKAGVCIGGDHDADTGRRAPGRAAVAGVGQRGAG
ncbi:RNA-directed DNA polymerase [Aidingimonas halophila]|uniref:RNA-directed DNA polymerase n=1 Tax=Aidingimonas halophila TaxID=574349 RepID=A0A1H3A034_9GAMM|nr:reverse transcriptase domain-containing protein [Aidingimonas halophila]GHC21200.1 hypothetical protein GCM10008094_09800 [Aidingimonas halophila]SDX22598.1 RNA-directed DNA polymerase [Aidingimonas halophila]